MVLLQENQGLRSARALVRSMCPKDWVRDPATGLLVPDYRWLHDRVLDSWVVDPDSAEVLLEDETSNVITNAGRDFLHLQGYGVAGLGINGLNFVALSNDALTETSASTTLSSEIVLNGLGRAAGTVAHTAGTNTTTVDKTFTCATAAQSAQKAALFTLVAAGTMNHALAFTQRSLQVGDTLQITFTISLG